MQSIGLDVLPLWGLFVLILLVVLLSVECGYRLGKYRRSRQEQEKEAPVGTMVGATLGLLAYILAFTFGLAAARFDARRQVLLDEANALFSICNNRCILMVPLRRTNIINIPGRVTRDCLDFLAERIGSGAVRTREPDTFLHLERTTMS